MISDWILDENFINTRIRRSRYCRKPIDENFADSSKTWNYHNNGFQISENGNEESEAAVHNTGSQVPPTTQPPVFENSNSNCESEKCVRNRRVS